MHFHPQAPKLMHFLSQSGQDGRSVGDRSVNPLTGVGMNKDHPNENKQSLFTQSLLQEESQPPAIAERPKGEWRGREAI